MDLIALLDALPGSTARLRWLERGVQVRCSAAELHADVEREAERLRACGIGPGQRVGIRAANSYRWLVVDLALLRVRAQSVAFTADFNDRGDPDLIAVHRLSLLFTDRPEQAPGTLAIDDKESVVVAIPAAEPESDPDFDRPWQAFSSGSAGGVKGLMLSRRGVEAAVAEMASALACTSADSLIVFLPMSNFQQRLLCYGVLWIGGELILSDPVTVYAALRTCSPTIVVAPPVFYDLICAKLAALPRSRKAALALVDGLSRALPRPLAIALRRRAYHQVHAALGGRLRIMITGMAPTGIETLRTCERMGLPLFETYGQIEVGSVSINLPGAARIGSVGRPLPGVDLRFGEDGEILIRKAFPVTLDYTQAAPGEAARVFLPDGWVASGDIGRLDAEGYLFLKGRKKLQLISPGGTKFHPELLEQEVERCAGVRRAVVYQDEAQGHICIVVSAEQDRPEIAERVEAALARHAAVHPEFRVRHTVMTRQEFSFENGLLLPNLKIDRQAIVQRFHAEPVS